MKHTVSGFGLSSLLNNYFYNCFRFLLHWPKPRQSFRCFFGLL